MIARTKDDIIAAYQLCWDSISALGATFSDEDWRAQSLCPDWSVHGVLLHLTSVDHALLDWPDLTKPPFEAIMAFQAEHKDTNGPELLALFDTTRAGRADQLADASQEKWDTESFTPVGPGTYGRFMTIRAFDHWIHEQDMRRPTSKPGHGDGLAAEVAIDEIESSLGFIVGKKIAYPEGKSLSIHLAGPVVRDMHATVDGRARTVASVDNPDAEIMLDSTTFAQLACGRIDPAAELAAGTMTLAGDPVLADQIARNLAFTM